LQSNKDANGVKNLAFRVIDLKFGTKLYEENRQKAIKIEDDFQKVLKIL
jgi:hypothetical protein